MIAWLKGKPHQLGTRLMIETQGVGYGVEVGPAASQKLMGQTEAELFIHTHVREDQLTLFGFLTLADQHIFELLLQVSGVGPKTALVLVDRGSQLLTTAVQNADVTYFTTIPRVGTKLAQKIIIELKSKLGSLQELSLGPTSQLEQDVVESLVALGFAEGDAYRVLPQLNKESADVASLIKQAMKLLGKP